jgi:hypothetical protein
VSSTVPSLPGSGAGSSGNSGVDAYIPRFLLWLWDRTDGRTGEPVSCAEFGYQQLAPSSLVRTVVDALERQRLVRAHGDVPAGDPVVSLEAVGVEQVRRLRELRADDTERYRYARRALLAWILARADQSPLHIEDFFDSAEVFFLGQALAPSEVSRTAEYLAQQELITCTDHLFDGRIGSHVALTDLGMDAVLSEYDIDRFLERRREQERPLQAQNYFAGNVNTVHTGPVHGDWVVNVTQELTPEGTEQLARRVAELVRQLAPVLTPEDDHSGARRRAELLEAAEALRTEDARRPDGLRQRQRGGLERVQDVLQASPESVGRQLMLQVVGAALGALGGVGLG